MKNLAFLLLFLTLFTACKQKEEKLPVNPEQWLSQIKNEEAKKRTIDVLEKIYISTAYSVLEKDSLSEMQVNFANCGFTENQERVSSSVVGILLNRDIRRNFLDKMYRKDSIVAKAAFHVLLDTNSIDLGRYYNSYKDKQYSIKKEVEPSKQLEKIENELLSYLKVRPYYDYGREDSISKVGMLLEKALKQPNSYEYGLPKFIEKNGFLVSEDKKFRLHSYKFGHGNSVSAYVYIHYRSTEGSQSIFKEIDSLGMEGVPKLVFQLEENKYGIFYNHGVGGMDYHVLVQVYEVKDNKIVLCKDCVEGEHTKFYMKQTRGSTFPVYDYSKKELSFDKGMFRGFGDIPYWNNVGYTIKQPIIEDKSKRAIKRQNMERRVLKWNGERLISKPFICCEE
ncbi:hypothetical protein Fleli_2077 [Bernardetia litoralis DSM 6794]|uniref:Lipoprotein n=1 Tax=Bernardetia litoralis (strain ATCC 23117 / DSM 6794 / NBRC 15988 / NCIMB 1366 / Fx l1 / Sio-4) TaxID=880071 RepID=I4AKH5_BERLS|nr:hypothetical protein [Bernardetia litoralis]AFM04460.1 hypothetical protein Fleli_2077 [Bernardetia litoralis DSM 6794]